MKKRGKIRTGNSVPSFNHIISPEEKIMTKREFHEKLPEPIFIGDIRVPTVQKFMTDNAKKELENRTYFKKKFTAEELQAKIDEYFKKTKEEDITITWLALHLWIYKNTFLHYEKSDIFWNMLSFARLRVENAYEKSLRAKGGTGNIFALKNFWWNDEKDSWWWNKVQINIITPQNNQTPQNIQRIETNYLNEDKKTNEETDEDRED